MPSSGCSRASRRGRPAWTGSTRTCAKEAQMTDATADQQVLITRIFDAPRERVFQAWTDPAQVAAWYGPEHMDAAPERVNIDLRVGGRWELTMVPRDGAGREF